MRHANVPVVFEATKITDTFGPLLWGRLFFCQRDPTNRQDRSIYPGNEAIVNATLQVVWSVNNRTIDNPQNAGGMYHEFIVWYIVDTTLYIYMYVQQNQQYLVLLF